MPTSVFNAYLKVIVRSPEPTSAFDVFDQHCDDDAAFQVRVCSLWHITHHPQ